MKITKRLYLCWFKDKRYDKTIYDADTIIRFGRIGIVIKNKDKNS